MKVQILRAVVERADCRKCQPGEIHHRAEVVAFVDDFKVTFKPSAGWVCRGCNEEGESCTHVGVIASLIAPNITSVKP